MSIENFYLVGKQNKDNFVKKNSWIRRFVDSAIVKTCDELDRYLEVNEDEDTLKNEVLHSVATALANMVLPFVFDR